MTRFLMITGDVYYTDEPDVLKRYLNGVDKITEIITPGIVLFNIKAEKHFTNSGETRAPHKEVLININHIVSVE